MPLPTAPAASETRPPTAPAAASGGSADAAGEVFHQRAGDRSVDAAGSGAGGVRRHRSDAGNAPGLGADRRRERAGMRRPGERQKERHRAATTIRVRRLMAWGRRRRGATCLRGARRLRSGRCPAFRYTRAGTGAGAASTSSESTSQRPDCQAKRRVDEVPALARWRVRPPEKAGEPAGDRGLFGGVGVQATCGDDRDRAGALAVGGDVARRRLRAGVGLLPACSCAPAARRPGDEGREGARVLLEGLRGEREVVVGRGQRTRGGVRLPHGHAVYEDERGPEARTACA